MPEPVRLFVGCAANHEDAESQTVLEWSIRKHASLPVEITWMRLSKDPASPFYCDTKTARGWRTDRWTTPFSGFRWAIPEICGFAGRAIYSDSDIIYLADIADLWTQDMGGKVVLAKEAGGTRFCVSLWDCAAAKPHVPPLAQLQSNPDSHLRMTYFYRDHPNLVGQFEGAWNCHDKEKFPPLDTWHPKALHYTQINTQPQLRYALPRLEKAGLRHWYDGKPIPHPRKDVVDLFDTLLEEATAKGYGPERYCDEPPFGTYRKKSLAGK